MYTCVTENVQLLVDTFPNLDGVALLVEHEDPVAVAIDVSGLAVVTAWKNFFGAKTLSNQAQ